MQDMTPEEQSIMIQHVAYWKPYIENETMLVYGPVMDPKGGFGMGVIAVVDEDQLKKLIAADPAAAIGNYEYYPMRAVTKQRNGSE